MSYQYSIHMRFCIHVDGPLNDINGGKDVSNRPIVLVMVLSSSSPSPMVIIHKGRSINSNCTLNPGSEVMAQVHSRPLSCCSSEYGALEFIRINSFSQNTGKYAIITNYLKVTWTKNQRENTMSHLHAHLKCFHFVCEASIFC